MAVNVFSDGTTVTVTTEQGHRIGFAMTELHAASTAGDITTTWADGATPDDPEAIVRAAKAEAEAYVARHEPEKPAQARTSKQESKGLGGVLKDIVGLP